MTHREITANTSSTDLIREIIRRIVKDGEEQTPEFFTALEDLMSQGAGR